MSQRMRKVIGRKRIWLMMLISVTLLVVLGIKAGIRLDNMVDQFHQVNWRLLIGTFVFSVLWHLFVGTDKWWRIMRALGAPVKYWEVFRVRLGSDPIRFAVPLKAGEVVNAVYFARLEALGFSRAAGSVLFDKALNLFGAVFWLYVGFAAIAEVPGRWELAVHTAAGGAVLVLICCRSVRRFATSLGGKVHPKLGRLAVGVLSAFEEFSPAKKIGFLLYAIVFQLRPLAVFALLFAAFQPDATLLPSVRQFLAYGSVVVLMGNMPSMGGLGWRALAVKTMFTGPLDDATLVTIGASMSFAVQVLPAILGIPLMFPLLRAVTAGSGATAEESVAVGAAQEQEQEEEKDEPETRPPRAETEGLPSPSPFVGDDSAWI